MACSEDALPKMGSWKLAFGSRVEKKMQSLDLKSLNYLALISNYVVLLFSRKVPPKVVTMFASNKVNQIILNYFPTLET